jgi:hypothetical protein
MGKYKVEITAENLKFLDQEAGLLIRFPEQIPMSFLVYNPSISKDSFKKNLFKLRFD